MNRLLSLGVIAVFALTACGGGSAETHVGTGANAVPRTAKAIGTNARFTASVECESGELTPTRNPLPVPSSGSAVLHLTSCNASPGDRMGAYIAHTSVLDPYCTDSTDTTTLGTYGDGGSSSSGGDFAVIAGSNSATTCPHDKIEVTDITTGAIAEISLQYY